MFQWKTVLCLGMALLFVSGCGREPDLPWRTGPLPRVPSEGAPDGGWWKPTPGTSWQIQLSGRLDTSFDVAVYDVDLFDTPDATLAELHAVGRKVICYFSAGSFEDWRQDAARFPGGVIGTPLDGWPGERWLDIRSREVREVVRERLELAVRKGCDGVDPDNVDGYRQDTGFALTPADQLDFNRFLATEAHARGLAVGLKNDLDQIPQLLTDFDWVLNEECFKYGECQVLRPVIQAGKPVFSLEYGGEDIASTVCQRSLDFSLDTLVKNLELDAARISCR